MLSMSSTCSGTSRVLSGTLVLQGMRLHGPACVLYLNNVYELVVNKPYSNAKEGHQETKGEARSAEAGGRGGTGACSGRSSGTSPT
jgi:hypothetical protein